MNLAASLGIRLYDGALLLPEQPARCAPMPGLAAARAVPLRVEGVAMAELAPPKRARATRHEAAERKLRIVAAARARLAEGAPWESNQAIGVREGVSEMYVYSVLNAAGLTKKQRSKAELTVLVAQARQLLGASPKPRQGDVARQLGVTPSHLCMLLKRRRRA